MKIFAVFLTFILGTASCSWLDKVPNHKVPVYQTMGQNADLLIFKTDDIRIIDVKERLISYEYNDQNVTLAQIGDHAKRFCQGKGRDTVLVNMHLTNRHNFRRAYFECKTHPVLVPN